MSYYQRGEDSKYGADPPRNRNFHTSLPRHAETSSYQSGPPQKAHYTPNESEDDGYGTRRSDSTRQSSDPRSLRPTTYSDDQRSYAMASNTSPYQGGQHEKVNRSNGIASYSSMKGSSSALDASTSPIYRFSALSIADDSSVSPNPNHEYQSTMKSGPKRDVQSPSNYQSSYGPEPSSTQPKISAGSNLQTTAKKVQTPNKGRYTFVQLAQDWASTTFRRGIVDTGSPITIISKSFLKWLAPHAKLKRTPPIKIEGAGSSELCQHTTVIDFWLPGTNADGKPVMAHFERSVRPSENLSCNLLIGMDFLVPEAARIDISKGVISFGTVKGFSAELSTSADEPFKKFPAARRIPVLHSRCIKGAPKEDDSDSD